MLQRQQSGLPFSVSDSDFTASVLKQVYRIQRHVNARWLKERYGLLTSKLFWINNLFVSPQYKYQRAGLVQGEGVTRKEERKKANEFEEKEGQMRL